KPRAAVKPPPAAKVAPKSPVKPPFTVKPPPKAGGKPDPFAGAVQRPSDVTHRGAFPPESDPKAQWRAEGQRTQQIHGDLKAKASQAEDQAKRVRNTVRALEKKGLQPTQSQKDILANKSVLEKARNEAKAKLDQAKANLRALEPSQGPRKHGEAGLAQ